MRATTAEQDLVDRFVAFLNLDVTSTGQVEHLFADAMMVGRMQTLRPDEVGAYRSDQTAMRAVVAPLAGAFGSSRLRRVARKLAPQVRAGLGDKPFPAWVTFEERLSVRYALDGVALCCWVAVGLLLDEERGLLGRFGRCGACGRFNVTYDGKPRRHCSDEHLDEFRRKTAAKRMAKSRALRQRRKEK
jgi:hypothetical protein